MFKNILYCGANTHLDPITHFSETKSFVFIDSCPRNYYGYDYYYRGFYDKNFLSELKDKLNLLNFVEVMRNTFTNNYSEILVDDLDSTLIKYHSKEDKEEEKVKLRYYYSTGIPDDLYYPKSTIRDDIKECDTILISGHYPDEKILEYLPKPFHFIGYSATCFPENIQKLREEYPNDEKTVMGYILKNPQDIINYTLIDKESGKFLTFQNYSDFFHAKQSHCSHF